MHRILIQILMNEYKTLVYQIPNKQKFIDFISFNNYTDLGFRDTDKLAFEGCSRFAILTEDNFGRMYITIMLIDPYYSEPEIAFLSSAMFFQQYNHPQFQDIVIKSIIYTSNENDREIRLVQQFSSFLQEYIFIDNVNVDFKYYSEPNSLNKAEIFYERVPIILSDTGKIYVVTSFEGSCQIR